jgi:hypothetical protein
VLGIIAWIRHRCDVRALLIVFGLSVVLTLAAAGNSVPLIAMQLSTRRAAVVAMAHPRAGHGCRRAVRRARVRVAGRHRIVARACVAARAARDPPAAMGRGDVGGMARDGREGRRSRRWLLAARHCGPRFRNRSCRRSPGR